MRTIGCSIGLVMLLALGCAQPFTYQGLLKENGNPANGTYDFRFRLYDASSGGTQVGTDQFANDLNVQNGLFTTTIDFGATGANPADVNCDATVDDADLLIVLFNFGIGC
ncbi:MAG: hypothetical protein N2045_04395 [Fimbriimonadales bacterium]|jgi:hypothetical protein|nr:hypothetical protein [Fimbriimonadales bacterium]GBC89975.1 hypothetical protein HRbin14_00707 [bacterium HR14]GIV12022.1 MAG: hypothetical protein KatS3mg021_0304 [Fimbriimonadales bacterium]CUU36441.1 hypothetical protein GXSOP10_12396 [Armatimonadetes bacterium GXS]